MVKCNICKRTFVSPQGVAVHQSCTPACGGILRKRSGKPIGKPGTRPSTRHGGRRNTKVGRNGESGKEAIRQILSDHPQGLSTAQILDGLKKAGFKNVTSTYVSQTATKDTELRKAGRGNYRLKSTRQSQSIQRTGTAVVQTAVAEATQVTQEAEAPTLQTVLLRNEILETQIRALQDAHFTVVKALV